MKNPAKYACFAIFLALWSYPLNAQPANAYSPSSVTSAFHNIGWNTLHSLTYNYGLNFAGAAAGTWGFIKTGLDWQWRTLSYRHPWLTDSGNAGLWIGYFIPILTPAAVYTAGRVTKDNALQTTGLALFQSALITVSLQAGLKMITGRVSPGLRTQFDHVRNTQTDDFSGEFNWFNLNFIGGWPSGHTAVAMAAAATIAELYPGSFWLKAGAYTYSAFIGLSVTLNVHWASEALAGALIGYAVGKTVGKSFRQLRDGEDSDPAVHVSPYILPGAVGVVIQL